MRNLSEKRIVVHCPTQELWDKVCPGADLPSKTWGSYETKSCIRPSTKTYADIACYSDGNHIIISVGEYLKEGGNEVSKFKVGDRVTRKSDGGLYRITFKSGLYNSIEDFNSSDEEGGVHDGDLEPLKLSTSNPTTKTTKEKTMNINDNVLEVFENSKDAKKIAIRFGAQYGITDRDTLALKRDKKELLAIIAAEEKEAEENK